MLVYMSGKFVANAANLLHALAVRHTSSIFEGALCRMINMCVSQDFKEYIFRDNWQRILAAARSRHGFGLQLFIHLIVFLFQCTFLPVGLRLKCRE